MKVLGELNKVPSPNHGQVNIILLTIIHKCNTCKSDLRRRFLR